ncbi:MAG: hypothetical protein U0270_10320 [Labilithrix sp.]
MLLRGALLGGLGALLLVILGACGSSKRAGNGGECFVATDCQEPLVCVEQKDGSRKCTDNLDSVVGEIPPEAAAPAVDAGAQAEGGGPSEAGPQEPADSGGGGGDQ